MSKERGAARQRVTDLQRDMSAVKSELGRNRKEFQAECDRLSNRLEDAREELEHLKEEKEEAISELKAEINGIIEERDTELELRDREKEMAIARWAELIEEKDNTISNRNDAINTLHRECGEVEIKERELRELWLKQEQDAEDKDRALLALKKRVEEFEKELNDMEDNAEDQAERRVVFNLVKVKRLTAVAEAKTSLVDEKEKEIEELREHLFRRKKERDDLKIQVVELYLHI